MVGMVSGDRGLTVRNHVDLQDIDIAIEDVLTPPRNLVAEIAPKKV